MLVYTRTEPRRASRVFDTRKAASAFQARLKRESHTRRQSYGIAVNYYGAGKGSRKATRSPGEVRIEVEYDDRGLPRMVCLKDTRKRHRSGRNIVRWMEPE